MDERNDSPTLWRSFEQFELGDAAKAPTLREFEPGQFADGPDGNPSFDRRRFLQIMGASSALAGAASCRWKESTIVSSANRADGRVPGVPEHYATHLELAGVAQPLVVTAYDGRPIKVEGNPEHPESMGAAGLYAQGAILEAYDPDRAGGLVERKGGNEVRVSDWARFDTELAERVAAAEAKGGQGLVVFAAEASNSPTLARFAARFAERFPSALWLEHDGLSRDNERAGLELAYGAPATAQYQLRGARVVVCLDSDLLTSHPAGVRHAREFAARRKPADGPMNRLYAVEATYSVTGTNADHRLPLRAEQVGPFLLALEAKVVEFGRMAVAAEWGTLPQAPTGGFLATDKVKKFVEALARDLVERRGDSVIAVGPGQPAAVHAVAARLNHLLGNVGATVQYLPAPERGTHAENLERLVAALDSNQVETLLILGGNPVYTAPGALGLGERLAKVPFSAHLSNYNDETSLRCTWHLPKAHWLESWADGRAADGSFVLGQPLMSPLYGGRTSIEAVAHLLGEAMGGEAMLRATFAGLTGTDDEKAWRRALHDGFQSGSAAAALAVRPRSFAAPEVAARALAASVENGELELVSPPDEKLLDGRAANNAWLQELPDFVTKLTWDNALLIAPATAKAMGLAFQDTVDLELGGRSLRGVAVYPLPGHAQGSATLVQGYGRVNAGKVGGALRGDGEQIEPAGFDVNVLRTAASSHFQTGLRITPVRGTYLLACTQEHFQMDATGMGAIQTRVGDHLIREGTVADYQAKPDFAEYVLPTKTFVDGDETKTVNTPYPPLASLWTEHSYDGHKWGLSIDLSACTGCNACVVACQSENNIPVVGKEAVSRGREMHWLRIDRYFVGSDMDDPKVATQPVACQQCELAPCEQVCPVAATVHSDEGLNDMVYNRCIGTRYCSNNCPFKVRKFNYFNYHKDLERPENEVQKLAHNPEVTVRMRGVMEKCTYCVQRIQSAKIKAGNERRRVRDGEVRTACQQTCPADAIRFGDLNDSTSAVRAAHDDPRAYDLLGYLNIKPRTAYLARIRNPNPALEAQGV